MSAVPDPLVLELDGPLDLPASLDHFGRRGDDLMERWDGRRFLTTVPGDGRPVAVRVVPGGSVDRPTVAVTVDPEAPATDADAVIDIVRRTIVAAPPSWPALLTTDPVLADLDARYPGLRPAMTPDIFVGLIASISAQQVNLAWAATTRRRLAEAFGERHDLDGEPVYSLSPARLAEAPVEAIRALQFTNAKAAAIVGVARAIADGQLDLLSLPTLADDEIIATLVAPARDRHLER